MPAINFSHKDFKVFRKAIGNKESQGLGEYTAHNPYGHIGRYQFGEAMLQNLGYYRGDATRKNDWTGKWTGKEGINSLDDFFKSPSVQEKAFNEGMQDNWKFLERNGCTKFVGDEIGGVRITEAGMLAAAWLNRQGLKRFLNSKGKQGHREEGDSTAKRLQMFQKHKIPFTKDTSFNDSGDAAGKVAEAADQTHDDTALAKHTANSTATEEKAAPERQPSQDKMSPGPAGYGDAFSPANGLDNPRITSGQSLAGAKPVAATAAAEPTTDASLGFLSAETTAGSPGRKKQTPETPGNFGSGMASSSLDAATKAFLTLHPAVPFRPWDPSQTLLTGILGRRNE